MMILGMSKQEKEIRSFLTNNFNMEEAKEIYRWWRKYFGTQSGSL
jgi:hypothetical protein